MTMSNDLILAILLIVIYILTLACIPIVKKKAEKKVYSLSRKQFKKLINKSIWVPMNIWEPDRRLEIYDVDFPPSTMDTPYGFLRGIRGLASGALAAIFALWLVLSLFFIVLSFIRTDSDGPNIAVIIFPIVMLLFNALAVYEFYDLFKTLAIRKRVLKENS